MKYQIYILKVLDTYPKKLEVKIHFINFSDGTGAKNEMEGLPFLCLRR